MRTIQIKGEFKSPANQVFLGQTPTEVSSGATKVSEEGPRFGLVFALRSLRLTPAHLVVFDVRPKTTSRSLISAWGHLVNPRGSEALSTPFVARLGRGVHGLGAALSPESRSKTVAGYDRRDGLGRLFSGEAAGSSDSVSACGETGVNRVEGRISHVDPRHGPRGGG